MSRKLVSVLKFCSPEGACVRLSSSYLPAPFRLNSFHVSPLDQGLLQKTSLSSHVVSALFSFCLLFDSWGWEGPSSGLVPWRREMAGGFHWFYLKKKCQQPKCTFGSGSWNKESRRGMNRRGSWGLAGVCCCFEKSCKVLWDQVKLPVWACWPSPF